MAARDQSADADAQSKFRSIVGLPRKMSKLRDSVHSARTPELTSLLPLLWGEGWGEGKEGARPRWAQLRVVDVPAWAAVRQSQRDCVSTVVLPLPKGEGWGEGEGDVRIVWVVLAAIDSP